MLLSTPIYYYLFPSFPIYSDLLLSTQIYSYLLLDTYINSYLFLSNSYLGSFPNYLFLLLKNRSPPPPPPPGILELLGHFFLKSNLGSFGALLSIINNPIFGEKCPKSFEFGQHSPPFYQKFLK